MGQINRCLNKLEENAPERHNPHTLSATLLLVVPPDRVCQVSVKADSPSILVISVFTHQTGKAGGAELSIYGPPHGDRARVFAFIMASPIAYFFSHPTKLSGSLVRERLCYARRE